MGLFCGIVGLPNVGKSTLFNAITASNLAAAENYPFCTIEPNTGVVVVPDERLVNLSKLYETLREVPATIEFTDIAGLVKGAASGEGLGNQFLSHIRDVDAILHVVRCFDDTNVIHVDGSVNPTRDIEIINAELIFKDMDTVEKKIDGAARKAKTGDAKSKAEADLYQRIAAHLGEGKLARIFVLTNDDEELWARDMHLITRKPVVLIANTDEVGVVTGNAYIDEVKKIADSVGAKMVRICAKIEMELAELPPEERTTFLHELGMKEAGLDTIVREAYDLLGLQPYFTAGVQEVRAWTVKKGSTAPQAAGVIHTDFERGFIRAEVIAYDEYVKNKGETGSK